MPEHDGLRLTHLGICVSDLARSVDFYSHALGFSETSRMHFDDEVTARILGVETIDLELVYLQRDGVRIELLGYRVPEVEGRGQVRAMQHTGFTHFSFTVGDIAAVTRRVKKWGGRVLAESEVEFPHGNRGCMAVDPDGARIELIEVRT